MQSDFKPLRFIGKYLRPHKKVLIVSLILSLFSTLLGVVQPYFAKILIDNVLLSKNDRWLIPLLSLLIGLLIIGFLIRVINRYIYTRYSAKLLFRMREDMFVHLHRIPLAFFTKRKIGDVYSRIASDMAEIQGLATETLPHYIFNFITCLFTASVLLWLNWRMALMSFVFLPVGLYIIYRIRPEIRSLSRQVAETNADIAHFLYESISNTGVIRAYSAEKNEKGKLKDKHGDMLRLLLRHQIVGAFSGMVPTLFIIVNTLIVFGYGGYLVFENRMTIGALVAFSIYQGRVMSPLQGMMDGFLVIQRAKVALWRVREIMDVEPVESAGKVLPFKENRFKQDIVFDNVSFAYEKENRILDNASFKIPGDKTTAIIGPSGSGKTTVCHLLLRFFDPDEGKILIDGIDLKDFPIEELRKNIALVSQDIFLFHDSIYENIRFSNPAADEKDIITAAKNACIHEFVESLPEGYRTIIGDRGVRLSGGQKQRISVARAILTNPKILVMDEATAFLDTDVEARLKQTIRELTDHRTMIVVSHRFSSIEHADHFIVFDALGNIKEGFPEGGADEPEYRNYRQRH